MKKFRLIQSQPANAVYNMALDEKIFKRYLIDRIPVLRIYGWSNPAFTYGFSQDLAREIDLKLCKKDGIGLAKRITGGGILFHYNEITYSFVCSKEDAGEPEGILVSYRDICAFLIRFYRSLGLNPSFALLENNFKDRSQPSELCSASYEKYDIVINGKKIGGNAQKRRRDTIFQHGSIPCDVDWEFVRRYAMAMPENISESVTTLSQELKTLPDKGFLKDALIRAFSSAFGAEFIEENDFIYETSVVE